MLGRSTDRMVLPDLSRGTHERSATQDAALDSTAGDVHVIQQLAGKLKRDSPERTRAAITNQLRSICVPRAFWNSHLQGERKSSEMLAPERAWGCSAHAQIACHLARACEIPAILVKSLNSDWKSGETDRRTTRRPRFCRSPLEW